MQQQQEIVPSKQEGTASLDSLKQEFKEFIATESAPEVEIQATTRKVTFKVFVGCGCGINYVNFEREVPFDSPIKDGDELDSSLIDIEKDNLVGFIE